MTMDELRDHVATTQWPLVLCLDGKEIAVNSRDELMVPSAGNSICVYRSGAFEVIDCRDVSMLPRARPSPQEGL